jgi:hypothetical protein
MASFEEQLLQGFGDGFNKRAEEYFNNSFLANRQSWVNSVVNDYIKHGTNPNESISKLATRYNLNSDQTQRIIEETNVNIYLQKYAQTKGRTIRRVVFPLADPTSINNIATTESKGSGEMSKAASTDMNLVITENQGNFLTSTASYEPRLWEPGGPEKTAKELVKRKLEQKLNMAKEAKVKGLKRLLQKIAFIGDALIYNERGGQSAQNLLDKVASSAGLDPHAQIPIIKYVREKTASLKEARKLPGNFNVNLVLATPQINEFSLGKHSLSKSAASNDIVIHVEKLPNGTDYQKLVEVAKEIKAELEKNPPKDKRKPIRIEGV